MRSGPFTFDFDIPRHNLPVHRVAKLTSNNIRLTEFLYNNWDSNVDLYSCNVPLVKGVETNKVMLTHALQNYWTSGSSFEEVEATEGDQDPETREKEIRVNSMDAVSKEKPTRHEHRHFKWAPKFGDIQKSIDASPPGNDGWAIHNSYTRYTSYLAAHYAVFANRQLA